MLYFPLHKNNALKILQFNTFQETCLLQGICLQDINPANGLKTFYVAIKIIWHVQKKTMYQRKMENFQGKYPKNYKDEERIISKTLFLYEYMRSAISTSALVQKKITY